jgi:hypothetical protein
MGLLRSRLAIGSAAILGSVVTPTEPRRSVTTIKKYSMLVIADVDRGR